MPGLAGATGGGPTRRGATYMLSAALAAAIYLIAFQSAREAPRESFVLAVLAIGAAINVAWLFLLGRQTGALSPPPRREAVVTGALAVCTVAGNYFVGRASETLDSGAIAALFQTEIFFVAAAGWLLLGERPRPSVALGAVVATAGVTVARAPGADAAWDPAGVGFALASSLAAALLLVIVRGTAANIHLERVNAYRLVAAAALALLLPGAATGLGALTPADWGAAAVAAAAGPVLSRLLQMYAVRELPAVSVKLGLLTTAVFAYALQALVFGRLPTGVEIAGASLILAGVSIPQLAQWTLPGGRRGAP